MIKPRKLNRGDTVAIISPAWGGPSLFPDVYDAGISILKEMGLSTKEYPTTRMDASSLAESPEARAKDINEAFADPNIRAIFCSIGGKDSIKVLPYLDAEIIKKNPKILMGFSDATTLLTFLNVHNVVAFHGPTIMAGIAQAQSLPGFLDHMKQMLFEPNNNLTYKPYGAYCDGYPNWNDPQNATRTAIIQIDKEGWNWVQGEGIITGEAVGGSLETLERIRQTEFWPPEDFWHGKILFLETSEDKPSVGLVQEIISEYSNLGIFKKISGLVFGRPRDYSSVEKLALNEILHEISKEINPTFPLITNFEFGHTDPQLILPFGTKMELDFSNKEIRLIEPWLE